MHHIEIFLQEHPVIAYITPLDPNVALCIGSFVGYLGTEQIKTIILRTVELKTNGGIQDHADDK